MFCLNFTASQVRHCLPHLRNFNRKVRKVGLFFFECCVNILTLLSIPSDIII